jgi:hypothetical protein
MNTDPDRLQREAVHFMTHIPVAVKELHDLQNELVDLVDQITSKLGVVTSMVRAVSVWTGVPNVWAEGDPDASQNCPVCGEDIGVRGDDDTQD